MTMENEPISAVLAQQGWVHDSSEGFIAFLGGIWIKDAPEGRSFGLVAPEFAANRNGFVHGGMLMSFIDRVFGVTARTSSGALRGSTVSLNHNFMTPMRIGDFAQITPRVTRITPRMAFLEGTLFCGEGPIVSAQGIWRLSHRKD
ncbi:PaaI family thioesterase [Xinfangfangia pollutisoli]|uniref:PaaI family thioesterase n=1 Tax=Xinfangfangia pollutisoli TaxID=2865960 RepID=UPI001CD5A6FF|nr:PaaI family thioesterase [Xinfangfangia pollutisoli]